jgi:S1-C subfamily serine protease
VLGQLTTGPTYDDLAAEIADLQLRLNPSLVMLEGRGVGSAAERFPGVVALRYRDDLAVTVLPAGRRLGAGSVIASDPASHLTVVRVSGQGAVPVPPPWTPRRPERPRYLVVAEAARPGVSLRPAFVGSFAPISSALWPEALWTVPPNSDLSPGSFVFTSAGEFVGLVTAYGGERAIVPGATLFAEAARVLARPTGPPGTIGIQVQDLTEPIAVATGASAGVVVTSVNQNGPAPGVLVGDVVEAVDDRAIDREEWDARMARLTAGQTLMLRVRSRGQVREVALVAAPVAEPPALRLGLTLRQRRRVGAEVVRVEPASAAARAGLVAGDVLTVVGGIHAPTPAQVGRSFSSMPAGQPLLVGVTRRDAHFVTTVER